MNDHGSHGREHNAVWLAIVVLLALIALVSTVTLWPQPQPDPWPPAGGTTNLDTLVLSEDLTVGDDLTVTDDTTLTDDVTISGDLAVTGATTLTGNPTYGSNALTPIGFDGSVAYETFFSSTASVTVTTVTSATHNMTTAVDWAICYVSDPDADANDPYFCVPTISGTSVTFQALDDDGDNATTAATNLFWLIIGR